MSTCQGVTIAQIRSIEDPDDAAIWNDILNSPCVYIISDGAGHCKVGRATRLLPRLQSMQTGCPFELQIIETFPVEDTNHAKRVEAMWHEALKDHHVIGEWYEEEAVANLLDEYPLGIDFDFEALNTSIRNLGFDSFCDFAEAVLQSWEVD